jgi:hypothetical protein
MKFVWDDKKAKLNFQKHGVSFDEATSVFFDILAGTIPDPDHSVGEHRLLTIGKTTSGRLVVVSHTEGNDIIRIISAREANRNERKNYES